MLARNSGFLKQAHTESAFAGARWQRSLSHFSPRAMSWYRRDMVSAGNTKDRIAQVSNHLNSQGSDIRARTMQIQSGKQSEQVGR